jgi:predicted nucleic acid-binding protein
MSESQYKYLIDGCALVSQKSNGQYRRKVLRTLWIKIDNLIIDKVIVTCKEVKDRLAVDDADKFLRKVGCVIFDINQEIQLNVTKIVNAHPDLIEIKNSKSSCDAFMIATAMAYHLKIITEKDKNYLRKLPRVSAAYDIACLNITDLAEAENLSF